MADRRCHAGLEYDIRRERGECGQGEIEMAAGRRVIAEGGQQPGFRQGVVKRDLAGTDKLPGRLGSTKLCARAVGLPARESLDGHEERGEGALEVE